MDPSRRLPAVDLNRLGAKVPADLTQREFSAPTYHGTVSGVLKNALDYVNDLIGEPRPFLDGRSVGCVAVAAGDHIIWLRTRSTGQDLAGDAAQGPSSERPPPGSLAGHALFPVR
ncbi:NADPH-dependent FMN reductase [Streptomyces youssoufiensis]